MLIIGLRVTELISNADWVCCIYWFRGYGTYGVRCGSCNLGLRRISRACSTKSCCLSNTSRLYGIIMPLAFLVPRNTTDCMPYLLLGAVTYIQHTVYIHAMATSAEQWWDLWEWSRSIYSDSKLDSSISNCLIHVERKLLLHFSSALDT